MDGVLRGAREGRTGFRLYGRYVNDMAAMPAAAFTPVFPEMLRGCKEMALVEPPISALASAPTPIVAPAVTPP